MRMSWLHRVTVLVTLACAAAQPAFGSSLVASALRFGHHAEAHAHSIALRSDGNHLDVVLSHADRDAHPHADRDAHSHAEVPQGHEQPLGVSAGDHVIHVTASDVASPTFRRALGVFAPALHGAISLPVVHAAPFAASHAFTARTGDADRLRTVVLRI